MLKKLLSFCPLTLEIFEDPYISNCCGKSFEKTEIDKHFALKNECPLCRKPNITLTPNRDLKDHIDDLRKQDPIPTFKLFQKDNSRLAAGALTNMHTQIEEKEYKEALKSFETALQFTQKSQDYKHLAEIYKKLGDNERSRLAHLTLALYQLHEGDITSVLQTLLKVPQEFDPALPDVDLRYQNIPQIHLLIIKLYQYQNQIAEALSYAKQSLPLLQGR